MLGTHLEEERLMRNKTQMVVCLAAMFLIVAFYDRALQALLHHLGVPTYVETVVTWLGSGFIGLVTVLVLLVVNGPAIGRVAARSFIITSLLVTLIKHIVGRARPYATLSPLTFVGPSIEGKYTSFPSGHAATAFAMALVIAWVYPKARIPVYLIAIMVALSRVALGVHWPSDVVVGGIMGLWVSMYCIQTAEKSR
jgi:undecaprenyl-diphosphatase